MADAFSTMWDKAAASMDAAVDSCLGDSILMQLPGETGFTARQGFVLDRTELGFGEVDERLGDRRRIKVSRAVLPVVTTAALFQHSRLGDGTWRPSGKLPDTEGRYWIFDVQKVKA